MLHAVQCIGTNINSLPDWEGCPTDTEDNLKQTLPDAASISVLTTAYWRESTAAGTNMPLFVAIADANLCARLVLFKRLIRGTPYASHNWINCDFE